MGADRIATLGIETTATDPADGELVSVGIGVYDRADPLTEATCKTLNRADGEELGPAYLRTLGTETGARFRASLTEVVDHYLLGDLEATLALYYADLGETVEGAYLGTERRFD